MDLAFELAVCVLLAALSARAGKAPVATSADRNIPVPSLAFTPQFMSMHMLSPSRHWPTVPVGAVRPAGTTWGTIEPSRGEFDWHGLDSWVSIAHAHHVGLDYLFLNTPQWASTRPDEKCNRGLNGCAAPPDDADWTEFVTQLVTRYKGRIASYEMWNEPNAIGFFTGTPAEIAHLCSLAYPIIKSIDPQAVVVSPSPSSTGWPTPYAKWLDEFLRAGGGKNVDVISWHAYAGYSNRPANPPEDVANQILSVRAVMAKNGVSDLPLWDTEGSWGTNTSLPDPQEQASYLARWYLIQFTYGVARVYWYQWDNPNVGTLWTEAGGPTPAAQAYAQVYQWLNGATGSSPCHAAHGSIWTCDIFKGSTKFRIAWSASGSGMFSDDAGFSAYTDLGGGTHKADGQPISVDSNPIFFR
jgi:hypothetical protein